MAGSSCWPRAGLTWEAIRDCPSLWPPFRYLSERTFNCLQKITECSVYIMALLASSLGKATQSAYFEALAGSSCWPRAGLTWEAIRACPSLCLHVRAQRPGGLIHVRCCYGRNLAPSAPIALKKGCNLSSHPEAEICSTSPPIQALTALPEGCFARRSHRHLPSSRSICT